MMTTKVDCNKNNMNIEHWTVAYLFFLKKSDSVLHYTLVIFDDASVYSLRYDFCKLFL